MSLSALTKPDIDPTPIFELFRGSYGTELLTAAIAHFNVFGRLHESPLPEEELQKDLGLARRPFQVLLTALKAFRLVESMKGKIQLTRLAEEHLVPGGYFDVGDYVGLAANSPGVLEMVERLRTNKPAGAGEDKEGTAYVYREGSASAMEQEDLARHFTMALAGRAKNVAPYLATKIPLADAKTFLDIGGGTGIYTIASLQENPHLKGIVFDRPEVLKVAAEMAEAYGVADRLQCQPGDMFRDELPKADILLLSNILHDWDEPDCRSLVQRCSATLPSKGRLLIHDVFLNDSLDGPLPIALYSAALFTLTEGRAYSAAEYRHWVAEADLQPQPIIPTLVHCGVLTATKK